eukprot:11670092-Karenia_brevis.AAC.1
MKTGKKDDLWHGGYGQGQAAKAYPVAAMRRCICGIPRVSCFPGWACRGNSAGQVSDHLDMIDVNLDYIRTCKSTWK